MMDEISLTITDIFLGNGIIIVIGCFIVGMFIKGSFKRFPNKYIPYVNALIAVVLGFAIPDTFDDKPVATKIILLLFLGLSSVGLYEAICTVVKDRFSIDLNKIYNNMINDEEEVIDSQKDTGDLPDNKDVDMDIDIPVNNDSDEDNN